MKQIEFENYTISVIDNFMPMTDTEKKQYFGDRKVDCTYMDENKALITVLKDEENYHDSVPVSELMTGYVHLYSDFVPGYVKGEVIANETANSGIMTFQSNSREGKRFNFIYVKMLNGYNLFAYCSCMLKDAVQYLDTFSKAFINL